MLKTDKKNQLAQNPHNLDAIKNNELAKSENSESINQVDISNNTKNKNHKANNKINPDDRLDFKLAFKIFAKYLSYYKLSILAAFIISLISTTFNIIVIIGMGDIQTFFSFIVLTGGNEQTITLTSYLIFSGLMLVSYFLNSFFQWVMNLVVIKLSQGIGYKMRMDLFNKVQILSVKYFDTHESGDIMSVLTNDVYNLVQFISQNFTQTMYGITTMLGMLILMFIISPVLSIIVIAILAILLSFISILIRKSGPAFMRQQRELGHMNGYIEETISGQNIINLFSQQENVQNSFEKINKKLVKSGETSQGISGLLIPWLNFLMNFVVAILYGVGATFAAKDISFFGADASVTLYAEASDSISEIMRQIQTQNSGITPEMITKLSLLTSMVLATRNFIQPINQVIAMVAQMQQAVAVVKELKKFSNKKVNTKQLKRLKLINL